jgi:hypothetical protein
MISTIISILIALWLIRSMVDILAGIFQIFFGLGAALIGAAIFVMIFLIDVLARLWRIAS